MTKHEWVCPLCEIKLSGLGYEMHHVVKEHLRDYHLTEYKLFDAAIKVCHTLRGEFNIWEWWRW